MGFEPTRPFLIYTGSNRALSSAQPTYRCLVVPVGLEPTLTANLAYRAYKARRASYYTTGQNMEGYGRIFTYDFLLFKRYQQGHNLL